MSSSRRIALPLAALAIVGLALTGCSSGSGNVGGSVGTADGVVRIEGPLIGADAKRLEQSWAGWEKANNIKIEYTGSANFQENIGGEAQQGNAPDLAIFEQPGLINDLAARGYIHTLPSQVKSTADKTFPSQWVGYTTVAGSDYGVPLLSSLNGWVFYSPSALSALNQKVPTSWSQLLTLSEYLRAGSGSPPWCEGFDSNASSGALGASFIDDMVLREDGTTVYDQWIDHKISFSDPDILKAFNDAGEILQNKDWVNSSFGGVTSIDKTTTAQVAKALESGKCDLSYEPSSFIDDLKTTSDGVETIGPQQQIWAFLLPSVNSGSTQFTQSGDFVAAFSSDSDTVKVQDYLASLSWAKSRMKLGGAISPAKGIIPSDTPDTLLNASVALMQGSEASTRLSAGDLMPSIVGEGTYLSGVVDWINGTPAPKVLSTIDGSWPKS
ncbi:MAG TPA: extracellular solute-binding protein [Galbitalea sp.]|jgi:alpha-glucoside transport system substrate-binding protein|nr:extracellular solute-binding protein [Galbitalea sp.]